MPSLIPVVPAFSRAHPVLETCVPRGGRCPQAACPCCGLADSHVPSQEPLSGSPTDVRELRGDRPRPSASGGPGRLWVPLTSPAPRPGRLTAPRPVSAGPVPDPPAARRVQEGAARPAHLHHLRPHLLLLHRQPGAPLHGHAGLAPAPHLRAAAGACDRCSCSVSHSSAIYF